MCCQQLYTFIYIYIKQATEVTRREDEILEQEQQNVTASVEHTAQFGHLSTLALQVRQKLKDNFVSILWT